MIEDVMKLELRARLDAAFLREGVKVQRKTIDLMMKHPTEVIPEGTRLRAVRDLLPAVEAVNELAGRERRARKCRKRVLRN